MRFLAATATLAVLTASPVAVAQTGNPAGMDPATRLRAPGTPAPHQPNIQDKLFVRLMAAGNMAEVGAAKLAAEKATSPKVKDFAQNMVRDHGKANEKLKRLAEEDRIPVPSALDPDHKAVRAHLDRVSGAEFDLAYMRAQLVEHQKAAQVLEWEISYAQDAQLKAYAVENLPVVLEHLQMAQLIFAELTGSRPQGLASEIPHRAGALKKH